MIVKESLPGSPGGGVSPQLSARGSSRRIRKKRSLWGDFQDRVRQGSIVIRQSSKERLERVDPPRATTDTFGFSSGGGSRAAGVFSLVAAGGGGG